MTRSYMVVAALLLAACSEKPMPAAAPGAARRPIVPPTTQESTRSDVNVAPEIVAACGMPTPHFAFDSSALGPDEGLDALATCFTTGPMKGRKMVLVGHADPRGETEYNFALGQRRSGSVQDYLTHHRMNESNVTSTSRGELDARGTDEAGWAQDRRVDVSLGD